MSFVNHTKKTLFYVLLKNYKLISVALAVLIVGFGAVFFLTPKYQTIQNQGLLDVDTKKELLAERQQYLTKLQAMVNEYRSVSQSQLKILQQVLPAEQELPELFVMLDQIGRDLNLTVSRINMSPQTTQSANPVSGTVTGDSATATGLSHLSSIGIVLNIEAEGFTYGKFKQMLETLEQNSRIFDLTSVSYSPSAESFTVNLTTYYLES